ncbi:MAG: HD domain-containing protein, partial [Oscillospiraceae bacterium]|nr:HD domain-containing protein [Oscillospiraceae bacterium]
MILMNVKRYLTAFLCVLFTLALIHPAVYAEAAKRRDLLGTNTVYTAILYDSLNGLPTSEANAIAQNEDGFIWIGGYSGLTRYDGSEFYHFDSKWGISSVFSLYVDSKDRLWIGTNEDGIAYFDKGEIVTYGRVEGLRSYSVRAINEDRNGNIIIATTQGLAYVGQDMQVHLIDSPQVNSEYITSLEKGRDGVIYGLTLDGAFFELEDLKVTSFFEPDNFGTEDIINSIYPDPDIKGMFYMGTTGSEVLTVSIDRDIHITRRRSTRDLKNIKSMLKNNGILWIAATNGLGYIDENSAFHMVDDVPLDNSIGHIMRDHEGDLWFTSTRQGVLKLVPDRFTDISKFAGIGSQVINSTCISGSDLYLGTDEGLIILDKDHLNRIDNELSKMMEDVRIRCIKADRRGDLWLCTHGDYGLVRYDPTTGEITCIDEQHGLDAGKVRTVLELSDGRMAAATGNGLYIVDGDKVTEHYGHENGISTTEILCVAEAPNGTLYLGSDGAGIYAVDGNRVRVLGFDDGLTSGVVMQIKYDERRDLFWIITSNSIEYMKDGVITPVTNFPYSNNLDMYFDNKGNAWVLSSNGIYITEADDLLTGKDLDYNFYNVKSGLPYITTSNSRSFLDREGHLYISGTTGCCMVNINADYTNNDTVKLVIPMVEIDDETVVVADTDTVKVPAGARKLTVDMFAITYALNNPRISYYLEGFDPAPIHTTKQEMHAVTYTNLDGGQYVFHLDVIDENTGEISKTKTITIVKEASPYESPLFWTVLAAAVILATVIVMWQIFRKKTAALVAQQEEDRKFITQIMHTFANCVDMRDQQNQGHSFRVAYYTRLLAQKLAWKRGYTDDIVHEYYNIALLHDIGKLSIPDAILNKPGRLDDDEFLIMRSHAAKGEELLKNVTVVRDLAVGAGCHHERIDGKGYPRGLKGDEIPDVAKVIAVADTFDTMYSTRPYRKQMLLSDVIAELKRISGAQLDEEVVAAMVELYDEGELDRQKVDEAVARAKHPTDHETDEEKQKKSKKLEEDNKKFMESLGLISDDEEDGK